MDSLRPEAMTWTALLGKWMQFAQASVAVRVEDHGPQWRGSVPSIIALQAVTFALGDLDRIPIEEHALAIDKAEVLIRSNRAQLETVWRGHEVPAGIGEIIEDAALAVGSRLRAMKSPDRQIGA